LFVNIGVNRIGYGCAIVMEDIGGVSLKSVIPTGGFSVDEFLEIACCISMSNYYVFLLIEYSTLYFHIFSHINLKIFVKPKEFKQFMLLKLFTTISIPATL
jgi:hypothetical protein